MRLPRKVTAMHENARGATTRAQSRQAPAAGPPCARMCSRKALWGFRLAWVYSSELAGHARAAQRSKRSCLTATVRTAQCVHTVWRKNFSVFSKILKMQTWIYILQNTRNKKNKNIQKYNKYDPQKYKQYDAKDATCKYQICRNGLRNQILRFFVLLTRRRSLFLQPGCLCFNLPECKKTVNSRKCFLTTQKDNVAQHSIGLVGAICIVALIWVCCLGIRARLDVEPCKKIISRLYFSCLLSL